MQYKKLYQLTGFMVSAVFVYLLVEKAGQIDFQKIRVLLKPQDLLLLVILLFTGYAIRVWRWKILLDAADINITFSVLYVNFIMSVGINNVLPFRAGDVYRVVGVQGDVTKTQLFGSVLAERIMDISTLLIMFFLWLSIEKFQWEVNVVISIVSITVFLVSGVILVFLWMKKIGKQSLHQVDNEGWKKSLFLFVNNLSFQLKQFFGIKVLLRTVPLSILGWIPEILIFLFVAHGLGIDCSFSLAALTHAFATLSTMVPSSPGFFGTYHYAAYYVLSAYSIDQALILMFAVIAHCVLWLPPIIVTILLSVGKFYRHKAYLSGD